jgi:predicted metal-binding protein
VQQREPDFLTTTQRHTIRMTDAVFLPGAGLAVATEIIICTTCRPATASRDVLAAGEALLEAVQVATWDLDVALQSRIHVRGVACLSGCTRACTVALQAPGKYTYFFGDLVADGITAIQVLACAQLHAYSTDGNLRRKERPERLRSGILARLPPLATLEPGGP